MAPSFAPSKNALTHSLWHGLHAQLLWTCKECYVYQIPPLKNESGHRANDWDVNKWLWSGALKVTSIGNVLNIILHDATTGQLFAQCPVKEVGSKAVDQVRLSSSRRSRATMLSLAPPASAHRAGHRQLTLLCSPHR